MGPSRHSHPAGHRWWRGHRARVPNYMPGHVVSAVHGVRVALHAAAPMSLRFNRARRDFVALMVVRAWRVSTQARATGGGGAGRTTLLKGGSTWRVVGFGWGVGVG